MGNSMLLVIVRRAVVITISGVLAMPAHGYAGVEAYVPQEDANTQLPQLQLCHEYKAVAATELRLGCPNSFE